MPSTLAMRHSVYVAARITSARIGKLTEALSDGKISISEWRERCAYHIKRLHSVAAVAANNGKPLSPHKLPSLNGRLAEQLLYLQKYAQEMEANPDLIRTGRAKMYAAAARGTFEELRRDHMKELGYKWERRVLGAAEHCNACEEEAARGWQPIGTLKSIGSLTCLTNCACRFRFSKSLSTPAAHFDRPTISKIDYDGIIVNIEFRRGETRRGTDANGSPWRKVMMADYGNIVGTKSDSDGDRLDVYVGQNKTQMVYVIDQIKPDGSFDELKIVLGAISAADAKRLYVSHYPLDWTGFGGITAMSMPVFKALLKTNSIQGPLALAAPEQADFAFDPEKHPREPAGGEHGGEFTARQGFISVERQEDGTYRAAGNLRLGKETAARVKSMKLPPAWTGVHVSLDPKSELQAVGRDAKGREQRIYSAEHWTKADREKFLRAKAMVAAVSNLEAAIRRDCMERDEAAVLLLIRKTGFRIGGTADTKTSHKAIGASTLTNKHVKIEGDKITFSFTAKKGVRVNKTVNDKELADVLRTRLSRRKLFNTTDGKVREYLKEIDGSFKVKDFRTLVANEVALKAISVLREPRNEKEFKKFQRAVAKTVARKLGNTAAVSLKSYISPEVFEPWKRKLGL